jgi:hypothetical protein
MPGISLTYTEVLERPRSRIELRCTEDHVVSYWLIKRSKRKRYIVEYKKGEIFKRDSLLNLQPDKWELANSTKNKRKQ